MLLFPFGLAASLKEYARLGLYPCRGVKLPLVFVSDVVSSNLPHLSRFHLMSVTLSLLLHTTPVTLSFRAGIPITVGLPLKRASP